jgi:anaerobic magnesium-protoporphyrin IX monomethyl ester cyclase
LRFIPLGIASIAAVLRQHGHEVDVVDFEVSKADYRSLPYRDYDVVGVSSDTTRWPAAQAIAEAAKSAGTTVVAGGPHVSFLDFETLSTGAVDYVVRSEGEHTMLELCDRLAGGSRASGVAGVSYLDDGELVRAPQRPFINDLDSLPMPARDLFPRRRYRSTFEGREMAGLVTTRGCPSNCDFCSCSVFGGLKLRTRSVESVIDELDYLYNRDGYRAVAFFDDNFTLNPRRAMDISEGILKRGWNLKWWAFSRTDTALRHPEVVRTMARAGLKQVFIGFESANQDSLDSAHKKASVEESVEAMSVFRRFKVRVWGAFMLGFDDETEDKVKNTIRFAKRLNPDVAQFTLVTPYPGTRLFDAVRDRLLTRDWEKFWGGMPTIDLPNLKPERLQALFWRAYRSFYLRPTTLARWAPHFAAAWVRYYLEPKNALKRYVADRMKQKPTNAASAQAPGQTP